MTDKQKILTFVICPNHETNEGKIYPLGNGIFKCSLCEKEFTREEIRKIIERDYAQMIHDETVEYRTNLARLYANREENFNIIDEA